MNFDKLKILFVAVFDRANKSTNNSQIIALHKIGCNVIGYNFRQKAQQMGEEQRDLHLEKVVKEGKFDLVLYSKCDVISYKTFKFIKEQTKTCLWFMDALINYNDEMKRKTFLVDYFCCDKKNVLEEAKLINEDSYYVCEGFDSFTDKPYEEVLQQYDISFIGNIYGERQNLIDSINRDVAIFNNVYGFEHPKHVAATKINLNFCTSEGASDRIYKILGAKGFLLSNDWIGREEQFQDGKDLIIFKDIEDLNDKIDYYLKNEKERKKIAAAGHQAVQKFNRLNWAKRIINLGGL